MQAPQQQLNLKDIHLPDSISWWPPATGYWLLLALVTLSIITYFLIKHYIKTRKVKKLALKEFIHLKKQYTKTSNKKQLVVSLSKLLRRAAISTYPRTDCAALTGKDWLSWLDKQLKKSKITFSDGPGYLLTDFVYSNSDHTDDITNLIDLSHQWLKQLPASPSSKRQVK